MLRGDGRVLVHKGVLIRTSGVVAYTKDVSEHFVRLKSI